MKKLVWSVAIVCVAMLCTTSCSNKERCWKGVVYMSYSYYDEYSGREVYESDMDYYTWGTEDEVTAALDTYVRDWKKYIRDAYGENATASFTIEKYKASEDECEDKDDFVELDDIEDAMDY